MEQRGQDRGRADGTVLFDERRVLRSLLGLFLHGLHGSST